MEDKIKKIIEDTLSGQAVECVGINIRGKENSRVIQICLDKENGITLDECAAFSRMISDRLDIEDNHLDMPSYRLEVSSPGLDRPLKTQNDFFRNYGRSVKVLYNYKDVIRSVEGKIGVAEKDKVEIILKNDTVYIPYTAINKAIIQINWS